MSAMSSTRWLVCAAAACGAAAVAELTAAAATRLAVAASVTFFALQLLKLHPRGQIDIGWCDLLVSLLYTLQDLLLPSAFKAGSRACTEAAIARKWSSRGDAFVCLSVRAGIDLALEALALPAGSEVLFAPGITIPAVVKIVEARGLIPRGLDPYSVRDPLPRATELQAHVSERTKVLVVTHICGAVFDALPLINEAHRLGLFVIEDCAQSFVGTAGGEALAGLGGGFRGHAESDVALVSFGLIKTHTCLGGAVGHVRDARLRNKMAQLESRRPPRSTLQFLQVVLKACLFKLLGSPSLWGLLHAIITSLGMDFDSIVVSWTRGFPGEASFQKRPSLPLLYVMRRRITNQAEATVDPLEKLPRTSVAKRHRIATRVADQLVKEGVQVLAHGVSSSTWWLLPMLSPKPKHLAAQLRARGYDATSTSTQLVSVASLKTGKVVSSSSSSASDVMRSVVYLPVTSRMHPRVADDLAASVLELSGKEFTTALRAKLSVDATHGLCLLLLSFLLVSWPRFLVRALPSSSFFIWACLTFCSLFALIVAVCRYLAGTPGLRVGRELLHEIEPTTRTEGIEFCQKELKINGRIDGAVLITGASGFVGGGVLFALLAKAHELGVTRIVVVMRKKAGASVESRLKELRANPAFEEVRDTFEKLVVALEADIAVKDFGWNDKAVRRWSYDEPLRAVLHCAGDVRFDQPLQQAAMNLISSSLQVSQLAGMWGAQKFVYVSTAFVHAVPSAGACLQERLVELRDFDPMELYRDALTDGRWAEKAMRELGFPNTYTFAKAVGEHLVLRASFAQNLDAHIVRPSIVGPAWAAPYAGWCGDKPSTVVGGAVLLAKRAIRVFRSSAHHCPIVPVDMVAESILQVLAAPSQRIVHATVDSTEAYQMPSFRILIDRLIQVLALRGDLSLFEAGFLYRAQRWAEHETTFWMLHAVTNLAPCMAARSFFSHVGRVLRLLGMSPKRWEGSAKAVSSLRSLCSLPAQYLPFTCPAYPWLFQSNVRLPNDWDSLQYSLLVYRGAVAFASSRKGPARGLAADFREVRVAESHALWYNALVAFSTPRAPMYQCVAAFFIRWAVGWMNLRITLDAASLESALLTADPIVLLPQHRSLLDFVILGAACFQISPLVPSLQVPHVAADAEFSQLPFLNYVLVALGAFFVRRGGGSVQPDPALRAEVGRVFRSGRPIEVFLEGKRSRGRRQLRPRSGLLRALRDVANRKVSLIPVGLSYELLPEDSNFYDELSGMPRSPLSTSALARWVLRGIRGELPPLGDAHVRLGNAQTLDGASELLQCLAEVQNQFVSLTCITTLHAHAFAEVLDLPSEVVVDTLRDAGMSVRSSRLTGSSTPALTEAERWPLAIQAAILLRDRLPPSWAQWFVEPADGSLNVATDAEIKAPMASTDVDDLRNCLVGHSSCAKRRLSLDYIAGAFSKQLKVAEDVALAVVAELRNSGTLKITQEHLVQQLLHPPCGGERDMVVPPPLALGAACIVASREFLTARGCVEHTALLENATPDARNARDLTSVVTLWPESQMNPEKRSNEEALDRWGFKDTRFVAQWVDGRPTVKVTSQRYESIGDRQLPKLWSFFQQELGIAMNVRDTLAERPLPELPAPAPGLEATLLAAVPAARIDISVEARLRAGTGHGLKDVWRLRTREVSRMPDAVVRPESEDEVLALVQAASGHFKHEEAVHFAIIPVGGRTNVTSATAVPDRGVDPRPFVALDMRGIAQVRWVNAEDQVAMVEAGITGKELQECLRKKGFNMGMEPDSMEFSTLGGWIATRASGMKRARYGNIEDMVVEARVATPAGILWQHHDGAAQTAFGRVSANLSLPSLVLGSEGCLGIIIAAVIRVTPLPECVEYESVIFPDWEQGAAWMRSVAGLPRALRPASCRLMDNKQLQLAHAIRGHSSKGLLHSAAQAIALRANGICLEHASAVTLVFEGSREEVSMQKRVLQKLVKNLGGMWGGASSGQAGYALTFAIAYLRDFALDYHILTESLETMAPWSRIARVWPAVVDAVMAEHRALRLPGRPFLTCRLTQIYDEGGVLYMYIAVCTTGLSPAKALEAFEKIERAARQAAMAAGGCLSHHHGVGKLRADLLHTSQAAALTTGLESLKTAFDPDNVFAAGNGVWAKRDGFVEKDMLPALLGRERAAHEFKKDMLGAKTSGAIGESTTDDNLGKIAFNP